jgi:hypothetical protein
MVSTNILYISLLSAGWVWAISAHQTPEQAVDTFLERIDNEPNWDAAYSEIQPETLDNFLLARFLEIGTDVEYYLNSMTHFDANTLLQDPTLNNIVKDLPGLIYLMRYANLTLLKRYKLSWPEGGRGSPLGAIDDAYLNIVAARYHLQKGKPVSSGFMGYMFDVAVLFSMNESMEVRRAGQRLPIYVQTKFENYQLMINRAEKTMARLMRIATPSPYVATLVELMREGTRIFDSTLCGYGSHEIQSLIQRVVHLILPAILMYGDPSDEASPAVFSNLLRGHQIVRHFLRLDSDGLQATPNHYSSVLRSLRPVVSGIIGRFHGAHPWISQIPQLLTVIRDIGNKRPWM